MWNDAKSRVLWPREGLEWCKREKKGERWKEKRETEEGKKDNATFCFYIGNFKQQKPFTKTSGTSEFVTPTELWLVKLFIMLHVKLG